MARLFVAAEIQAVRGQRLLDLFDRLLAEVRDRGQLVLALHDEVADRLDADALEAVVRADAELELLDRLPRASRLSRPSLRQGSARRNRCAGQHDEPRLRTRRAAHARISSPSG